MKEPWFGQSPPHELDYEEQDIEVIIYTNKVPLWEDWDNYDAEDEEDLADEAEDNERYYKYKRVSSSKRQYSNK